MDKWHVNWSGAIQAFPGLESLVADFENLGRHVQEQVAHLDQTVLAYFHQHPGANGSVEIDASADPVGAHSATVTLAAIPKEGAPPLTGGDPDESTEPTPAADAEPAAPAPLTSLTREQLNTLAREKGVEEPEKHDNKQAVVEAIQATEAPEESEGDDDGPESEKEPEGDDGSESDNDNA